MASQSVCNFSWLKIAVGRSMELITSRVPRAGSLIDSMERSSPWHAKPAIATAAADTKQIVFLDYEVTLSPENAVVTEDEPLPLGSDTYRGTNRIAPLEMTGLTLDMEGGHLTAGMSCQWPVEKLIFFIGFITAGMAVAAALYKLPSGIFDGHRLAYYAFIASAGLVGLGEMCVATLWMSGGRHHHPHVLARSYVLCASFLPLAFMAGLGGVRVLVK